MQLNTGARFGPYEIRNLLGSGGMGEVYRAHDPRLQRDVALKILSAGFAKDVEQLHRFEQEARAASQLNHPNILVVYDLGTQEGSPYLVTEVLEGQTLRRVLEEKSLSVRTAVAYAVQIASGLASAHQKNIVHRDLKPENIFVTRDAVVKILDFGLAKLAEISPEKGDSRVATSPGTVPGTILGTFTYMSPEQVRAEELDARSDIFSFGVVLYEMLAGHSAFAKNSAAEVMSAILRDEPDLTEVSKKVPAELVRLILHCLEKDRTDRFQSSRDLTFALRMIEANLYSRTEKTGPVNAPLQEPKQPSIAVLPFIDLSPQRDQEHFCDGMAEELISALTKLPGLRVASRTSAFQFKGHQADIRKIGDQLNVNTILEGSVRKAGNRVRITAELINVNDGYHLWSERYDRDLEDVFAIQEEIARTIIDTLKIRLVGNENEALIRRYTDNLEAYNLYLEGRHYWTQRTKEGVQKAIDYFEMAINKDPNYALAYCGLADCYSVLGFYAFVPPAEVYPKAKKAAERALEIDPKLAEAHLSWGAAVVYFENDWSEGEPAMKRAVELNPKFGLGHCWYCGFLSIFGRFEDSNAEIKRALEIDPLSPLFNSFAAFSSYNQRQYDQTLQHSQKALEIDSNFALALWYAGLAYLKKSMYEQSIVFLTRVVNISNRSSFFVAYLALSYGEAGQWNEAEKLLTELRDRSKSEYVAPLHMARVYLGLKQIDQVFAELDRAVEEQNVMLYLRSSAEFDGIRNDPRFVNLLTRVGLYR